MAYDACPVCGCAEVGLDCAISVRGKVDADVTRCANCGLLFVNPALTEEQVASIYDAGYWDPDPPGQGVVDACRRYPRQYRDGAAYGRRLARAAAPGRMLEVGCGLPFFLKGVADHCDWHVEGIDVASGVSAFAREKLGLTVTEAPLRGAAVPAESFDLVRAKDVIEHMSRPMAFLASIRRALRPGCRAELWLPNGPLDLAEARKAFRRGIRPAMAAGHVLFISPRVLRTMLEEAGFAIVRHEVSGFRAALRALGVLPVRSAGTVPGGTAQHVASSLEEWRPPAAERGLKGSALYAAYREWRSHHPALPAWLPLGFRQRVVARRR